MQLSCKLSLLVVFGCLGQIALGSDSIIVKKDPRLDILSAKQIQANQRNAMLTGSGLYKGYRIQMISTPKRDDAFKMKANLEVMFPDHKIYVIYQSPNFKVRIGNFLKKEEANKFKTQLNKLFPQGVYIVEDGIEYTPKDEDETITQ